MGKSLIYKVTVSHSGRDITEFVESIDHVKDAEKDDLVTFKFNSNRVKNVIDDPDIVAGRILQFQYGFLGGKMSAIHSAVISDVEADYGAVPSLDVKCLDKGQLMKRATTFPIWQKMTSSDIAKVICARYNLKYSGEETTYIWQSVVQGAMSDFDFMEYLSYREPGGDYQFYISDNDMFYKRIDLSKQSDRTYTYGVNIVKLKTKMKSIHKKKTDGSADAVHGNNKNKSFLETLFGGEGGKGLANFKTFLIDHVTEQVYHAVGLNSPSDDKKYIENVEYIKAKTGRDIRISLDGPSVFDNEDAYAAGEANMLRAGESAANAGLEAAKKAAAGRPFVTNKDLVTRMNYVNPDDAWGDPNTPVTTGEINGTLAQGGQDRRDSGVNKELTANMLANGIQALGTEVSNPAADAKTKAKVAAGIGDSTGSKKRPKILTATLTVEMEPDIAVGSIITIKGVAHKFSGNWYIYSVRNNLKNERPGLTVMELHRNGTPKPVTTNVQQHDSVNNTDGDNNKDKGKKAVGVRSFDIDRHKKK